MDEGYLIENREVQRHTPSEELFDSGSCVFKVPALFLLHLSQFCCN